MSDSPAPRDSGLSSVPPLPRRRSTHSCSAASPPQSRSPSPVAHDTLTLRALVSTKDAGVIIGKAGKNVADLREQTGVKAGVSKVIQGVHERVLTVTGPVEGVAKVRSLPLHIFSPSNRLFSNRPTRSLFPNSWPRIRPPP